MPVVGLRRYEDHRSARDRWFSVRCVVDSHCVAAIIGKAVSICSRIDGHVSPLTQRWRAAANPIEEVRGSVQLDQRLDETLDHMSVPELVLYKDALVTIRYVFRDPTDISGDHWNSERHRVEHD